MSFGRECSSDIFITEEAKEEEEDEEKIRSFLYPYEFRLMLSLLSVQLNLHDNEGAASPLGSLSVLRCRDDPRFRLAYTSFCFFFIVLLERFIDLFLIDDRLLLLLLLLLLFMTS